MLIPRQKLSLVRRLARVSLREKCYRFTSSESSSATAPEHSDILIVGGGAVGCALARLLNERLPLLSVSLIEARGPPPPNHQESSTRIPHPRSYAMSPRSLKILGERTLEDLQLGYYDSMQIWEAKNPASVVFTQEDSEEEILGALVEDKPLVASLWEQIQAETTCFTNTTVEDVQVEGGSLVSVRTNDGQQLTSRLLVAADGGQSPLRSRFGFASTNWDYGRVALTFTVELAQPHQGRAFQRFLPHGPAALLPTYSPHHAIVVWSTTPEVAQLWKKNEESHLVQELQTIFQQGPQRLPSLVDYPQDHFPSVVNNLMFGVERILDTVQDAGAMAAANANPQRAWVAPPEIVNVVSQKFSFPLSCRQVHSYVSTRRVALVGDAAHTVHPMAGQGLNLGLLDVEALVEALQVPYEAGMDFGSALEDYEKQRHASVSASLLGIHALHELFGAQATPLMHAKSFGMNVLQNLGPLRKVMAQAATQGLLWNGSAAR